MPSASRRRGALALAGLLASACAASPAAEPVRVVPIVQPQAAGFGTVVVRGLSGEALERCRDPEVAGAVLRLYVGDAPTAEQPPLMGRVRVEERELRFVPRFPLVAGMAHTVRFRGARLGDADRELVFALPEPDHARRTTVVAIRPGLDRVPANLLRIYVQFSDPMHARGVLEHVRLLDEQGREIAAPFLDVEDGLWDPERTRLTLFFHPGRVKRDVASDGNPGPPLQRGGRYRLEIDAALEDARGVPLGEPAVWSFAAGPADRESPDPAAWRLVPPAAPTAALEVAFGEPLDHALIARLLWVEDADGASIAGEARVLDGGTGWSFLPTEPWSGAPHALVAHPLLEDLAGNAVGYRFEERLASDVQRDAACPVRLEFPSRP